MYAKFGAFTLFVTIFVNFDANGLDYTGKRRVSITLCLSYFVPQGTINKNQNVTWPLRTYKRSHPTHSSVKNGIHFPAKIVHLWMALNVIMSWN